MISIAVSVLGILLATLIPAFAALYLVSNLLRPIPTRYVAAAGVGLTFWFFFDTMGDASELDVNSSIVSFGGVGHFAIIATFVAGIAVLAILDYLAVPGSFSGAQNHLVASSPSSPVKAPIMSDPIHIAKIDTPVLEQRFSAGSRGIGMFLIPAAVAAVMGIHGLGEGWAFGSVASSPQSGSDLIGTFGGVYAAASYPLHKFLEAVIIAAVYTAYVKRASVSNANASWQIPVLGLLFGLPSVIGASVGYFVSIDITFFYAFGVTSGLYAGVRLVEAVNPRFRIGETAPAYLGGKVFIALGIGFFLLYTAALFH